MSASRHPKLVVYGRRRLCDYPAVIVRLECPLCPHRRGRYRLARLAAAHGADITLDDLVDALVKCRWRRVAGSRPAGKYEPKCGAHLPDVIVG